MTNYVAIYDAAEMRGDKVSDRARHRAGIAAVVAEAKAEAWDEGHVAYQRRDGDDGCSCGAWSGGECLCGLYGTGTLLSVNDNPYRVTR